MPGCASLHNVQGRTETWGNSNVFALMSALPYLQQNSAQFHLAPDKLNVEDLLTLEGWKVKEIIYFLRPPHKKREKAQHMSSTPRNVLSHEKYHCI